MDKKNLLKELNRMNYLFAHKRGVVLSEQTPKKFIILKEDDDALAEDRQTLARINAELNNSVEKVQDSFINLIKFNIS